MVWNSVWLGIKALSDWHILLGVIGVAAATFIYSLLAGLIFRSGDSDARAGTGCLFIMLGGPFIQAIAVSAFFLFCLPVIMLGQGFTPWTVVIAIAGPVLKSGLLAMLVVLILAFIPLISSIIAMPGVPIFLQGIFMLRPFAREIYSALSDGKELPSTVFPGFWVSVFYIIIGVIFCYTVAIILGLIGDQIRKRTDPTGYLLDSYRTEPTGPQTLIGTVVGPLLGLLPLLMYGKYVALGIQQLTSGEVPA